MDEPAIDGRGSAGHPRRVRSGRFERPRVAVLALTLTAERPAPSSAKVTATTRARRHTLMRLLRLLTVTPFAIAATWAYLACGSRTSLQVLGSAEGGADASVADAPTTPPADAHMGEPPDTGPAIDPDATCNPQLPAPPPPSGCSLPSGRPCDPSCTCDDGCNSCECVPDAGFSTSDLGCGWLGTACTGPLSDLCNRYAGGPCSGMPLSVSYYCPHALLAACGATVCPSHDCKLHHDDVENGGSYWCCPK
jgi:hypothetical protein